MQVTIHTAETRLEQLIEAALAGEEVIIARGSKLAVKLVPLPRNAFRIGLLAGLVPPGGPDFLDGMNTKDLSAWEGR